MSAQVVDKATALISARMRTRPVAGIILGTGSGDIAEAIESACAVPYADLPGFPQSTAIGHLGRFVGGTLAGVPVIAMQGRFHRYEGRDDAQIQLPIEVMARLGIELLLVTNAAGGINSRYRSGELMALESHIDLMFRPWALQTKATSTGRPLLRSDIYDRPLIDAAVRFARQSGFVLHRGVYAALTGPNYETRAEYRFLRKIGADVAGMSTVPEVVAAASLGIRTVAFSVISNVANPDQLKKVTGESVVDAASVAAPNLRALIEHLLSDLGK